MGQSPGEGPEVDENLAKVIQGTYNGRGIAKVNIQPDKCLCQRPYSHVICLNCGHLMFGRVRYQCPKHKMVTFLIDITHCPRCKCLEYMLSEFSKEDDEDL